VLEAVVSLTALEGRMNSTVAVRTIAERARPHPKNAARALGRLRDRGIIDYTPGRGRGNLSTVALRDAETLADQGALVAPAELATVERPESAASVVGDSTLQAARAAPSLSVWFEPAEPDLADVHEGAAVLPARLAAQAPAVDRRASPPPRAAQPSSDEERLAAEVLGLFNAAAETEYTYAEWGGQVLERIRERPRWTLEQWADVIERAFAVGWWRRKLPDGEAPTPLVVFSSARQVESSLNVPDRMVRPEGGASRGSTLHSR
jgi:hypothetical protein